MWKPVFVVKLLYSLSVILSIFVHVARTFGSSEQSKYILDKNFIQEILCAGYCEMTLFPFLLLTISMKLSRLLSVFTTFQGKYGYATSPTKKVFFMTFTALLLTELLPGQLVCTTRNSLVLYDIRNFPSLFQSLHHCTNSVLHIYTTVISVSMFLVISIVSFFILKELQSVDEKIKIIEEEGNITASKLERLRKQQNDVADLLRNGNILLRLMTGQVVSSVSVEKGRNSAGILEQVLHYPILLLKVGGYYIETHDSKHKIAGKIILNVFYMLILVSGGTRILAGFAIDDEFSDKLMGRIVFAVAYFSNTIMFPVFIVAFTRNLPGILSKFWRFQIKHGFVANGRKMKSVTTVTFVVMIIFVIILGIFEAALTSSRVLEESGLFISRLLPFHYKDGYIFDLVNVIDTVACLHWTLLLDAQTTVVFVFSYIIINEFQEVTRKIDNAREKVNMSALELGRLKQKHHEVTELLQATNSVFQPNVLLNYMLTIPSICFGVYGIVHSTLGGVDVMILVFIFVMQLVGMNLVTALGAKINSEAHSALRSLFAFSLENLSIDAQHQLQVFISQLTSQTIGINVYGLFTMDGSTFLMIFGTVITYTVVVLQIQAGSCNVSHNVNNCNCTI
ncbi:uncharacterized protein LOC133184974 [Saccostrea echinata]|uniref:uncharacterized protein LOC133184974 n=1 Tax=Saccostrea echinata TaxID=191078 RepID=UPI002A825AFC|nr:uncharacterized protein LOC133184974 [Saccostrea echinata]